jgi:hypothetical protein
MYGKLDLKPLLTPAPGAEGRSKAEPGGQRLDVLAACDALLRAFKASMPADSDYSPPSPVTGEAARSAWRERMELVQRVRNEIEIDAMKVAIGWDSSTADSQENDDNAPSYPRDAEIA